MSDQPDYRHQVLTEIVAAIGTGPELTMDVIGNRLGDLYAQHQQADDQTAMAIISEAWGNVQMLASATDNAINIAAAAKEVAVTMMFQRDEVIETHAKLTRAIDTYDRNHPMVDDLFSVAEEMIGEELQYDYAYMHMCEASNMYEVAGLEISPEEANTFLGMLTDTAIDENTDPEIGQRLRDKISAFIREIVGEYDAAAELWDGAE